MTQQVFDEYSRYYDLLYADKDYRAEADYVLQLLTRHVNPVAKIVEFGSGTGRHGRLLAAHGVTVVGIERSPTMVEASLANAQVEAIRFSCLQGDVCHTVAPGIFDAVISLFHVVSYQTGDHDVTAIFANAARHLRDGGVFLFDVWHGPAVLTLRPTTRVKRVEDEKVHVTRIAEPTLRSQQNCVQVDYTLFARDKQTDKITTLAETHLMRYFTTPEVRMIAASHGFETVQQEEWLTGLPLDLATWGACYVLKKRARE